jgi:hypothetical protein
MADLGIGKLFHVIHMGETLKPLVVAWRVSSLDATEQYLAAKGVPVIGRDDNTILADPALTFGGPLRFTTWDVPGDPRT